MHDATCKLVAFTEVRVAIKSISNFQRHPDPNYSYFCILLLILKSPPGPPLALLFALIFRAALVVSWLLVVTPILEGKTTNQRRPESKVREIHQTWETYGKLIGSHGTIRSHQHLYNNTSGALALSSPCPLPCHPHLGGRPRADLGTSREFTKGIAALGIARHSTNNTTEIIIIKSHKLLGKSTASNRLESWVLWWNW